MYDKSVAIIGAGISASVCAKALNGFIKTIQVFEQADHVGGRLYLSKEISTTQSFTVSTPFFQAIVDRWSLDGVVSEISRWHVEIAEGETYNLDANQAEYSVKPNLAQLVTQLLNDIDVRLNSEVVEIEQSGDKWRLFDFDGNYLGLFDSVIISAATPSQYGLVDSVPSLLNQIKSIQYSTVWSVTLDIQEGTQVPFDQASFIDSSLSSCSKISDGKMILQATPEWSEKYSALSKQQVGLELKQTFCEQTQIDDKLVDVSQVKYWPFKSPINTINEDCLFDDASGFGVFGDWCTSPRIEGAVLSGFSIADRVMKYFSQSKP